jgi:hypothetical protein
MGAAVLIALASWSVAGPASAEYLVPEAGLRFPDSLGSLTLWTGKKFPQAGLGHGIEYRTRAPGFDTPVYVAGSIYVYDGGNASVPDGIGSSLVRTEFGRARGDIATIAKMNNLPPPELLEERTIKASGVEFLSATYRMVRNDNPVVSFVGLTGARRHFIKLRISVPTAKGATGTAEINAFVAGVARLLAASAGVRETPAVIAIAVDAALPPPATGEGRQPVLPLPGAGLR